ncbi:MAG: LiaI-LiaF-like domain-containing protein [Bdellovibrionota bacterium]
MTGIFVTLFGLNFLLKTLGVYGDSVSNIVWPVLIMLAGLKLTARGICGCCSEG